MSAGRHLLVFAALVVNLWLGGDLVEAWAGHFARGAFDLLIIAGYAAFALRLGALFRRSPPDA